MGHGLFVMASRCFQFWNGGDKERDGSKRRQNHGSSFTGPARSPNRVGWSATPTTSLRGYRRSVRKICTRGEDRSLPAVTPGVVAEQDRQPGSPASGERPALRSPARTRSDFVTTKSARLAVRLATGSEAFERVGRFRRRRHVTIGTFPKLDDPCVVSAQALECHIAIDACRGYLPLVPGGKDGRPLRRHPNGPERFLGAYTRLGRRGLVSASRRRNQDPRAPARPIDSPCGRGSRPLALAAAAPIEIY